MSKIHLIPTDDMLAPASPNLVVSEPMKLSPLDGFLKALREIDGEKIAHRLPTFAASMTATSFITWLIWEQSLGLYESSGFSNAKLAALGAIVLVVGSAAVHASQRSWKTWLLCLFVMSYEAAFMISGTMQDESVSKISAMESSSAFIHAKAEVERTSADYERYNSRFKDPTDKMFENAWFRGKFVDPSWEKFSEAQAKLARIKATNSTNFDHIGWLKVMYRLGLVLLGIMLVHSVSQNRMATQIFRSS